MFGRYYLKKYFFDRKYQVMKRYLLIVTRKT